MTLPNKRLCQDWITSYLEYNERHEAMEHIHRWVAMSLISAASRRRVFIELELGETKRVYPNLYVFIVAESARARKSSAMDTGRNLLTQAFPNMRIMQDSMTSQGLIKSLNHNDYVVRDNRIVEELRSDVAIFADEIANLFSFDKIRAAQMTIFLTRTYECPAIYDHTTARDSIVRLFNLYPTIIGGTDPRNLHTIPEAAAGGLTGRIIWLIESQRRANNSGWKSGQSLQQRLLREYLMHDLQRIANLEGEFCVTPEAQKIYDVWYSELAKRDTRDPSSDAFFQRCHTTALRVAEVVSLSSSDDLVITDHQMLEAIKMIEEQLPSVKRVLMMGGSSLYEQQRSKFLNFLQKSGGVTLRKTLLAHMGMNVDEFDRLVLTLVQSGAVVQPALKLKGEVVIHLSETKET